MASSSTGMVMVPWRQYSCSSPRRTARVLCVGTVGMRTYGMSAVGLLPNFRSPILVTGSHTVRSA